MKKNRKNLFSVLLLITLSMSAGCASPYSAKPLSAVKLFKQRHENALNSDKPSRRSQQYLRLEFLDSQYKKDPLLVTSQILETARSSRDAAAMIVAAELSLLNARKTYRKNHEDATTMLLNAAEISYDYLFMESDSTSFVVSSSVPQIRKRLIKKTPMGFKAKKR